MTWLEMLEKRIESAPPDSQIAVDTVEKKTIAIEMIERLRPADGLQVVIDEEPVFPWWLAENKDT